MAKSIQDLRTYLVEVFQSYSAYLDVPVGKIVASSDKIIPLAAPFINVSAKRLMAGEYVDNSENQAIVVCIFQTPKVSDDLANRDNLFDFFEKLEKIIMEQTPEINHAFDLEFQIPQTDTSTVYGALTFRTDYSPNPPEFE